MGAFGYYLYVRVTQTLNLKPVFLWYGIIMLAVECFGFTSVALYGINHLWCALVFGDWISLALSLMATSQKVKHKHPITDEYCLTPKELQAYLSEECLRQL